MNKRSKTKQKLGRKPNNPVQRSQKESTTPVYGNIIPFITVNGKKITPPRPNAAKLRNWSRHNPVVRRCIDIIKDRLTALQGRFTVLDGEQHDDLIKVLNDCLAHPNNDDTALTFNSMISEDLVMADAGCWEVAVTGNPLRPFFLFPTDGLTVNLVLDDPNYSFAQRITDNITATPSDYVFFSKDEMVYLRKHSVTNTPYGLSPIETAFNYIQSLMDTFEYSSQITSNALPKYMVNIKGIKDSGKLDEYRMYFQRECMGRPNLPMVTAEEVDSVQISPVSEEATYKEYQQFVMAVIAMTFGIPPEKVGVTKSNDRSKITDINESLLVECVKPYANVIVDGINKVLRIIGVDSLVHFDYVYEETPDQSKSRQDLIINQWNNDALTHRQYLVAMGMNVNDNDEYADDYCTVYKAKVAKEYGVPKIGNTNAVQNGGDKNV